MSLAKRFALAVLAVSLAACGGAELETSTEQTPPPAGEQLPVDGTGDDGTVSAFASCSGAPDYCLAECNDGINHWYTVGHWTVIAYGDCRSAAFAYCQSLGTSGHNGACWGS